jgi:uncharacterized damage-inducible protein DinB
MSESEHLADALTGLLSSAESGWFTPASLALEGISAEQAIDIPVEGFNSIASVVMHMSYWQEFLLRRLSGKMTDDLKNDPRQDWSSKFDPWNNQTWETVRERLFSTNKELAELIEKFNDEQLQSPYIEGRAKRYQVIQGIIAHNCYHTNEIITIRHLLGLWLERV